MALMFYSVPDGANVAQQLNTAGQRFKGLGYELQKAAASIKPNMTAHEVTQIRNVLNIARNELAPALKAFNTVLPEVTFEPVLVNAAPPPRGL
jgi:hypothetical protein